MAYIGQIILVANGTHLHSSAGFLPCDGGQYWIEELQALFSLIGNTYGGDGAGKFRVPNLPLPAGLQAPASYFICSLGEWPTNGTMDLVVGRAAQFAFVPHPGAAPADYLFCDGTSQQSSAYPALSAVLAGAYGTAGAGTFSLPKVPATASSVVTMPPNAGYGVSTYGSSFVLSGLEHIGQIVLLPTPSGPGIVSSTLPVATQGGTTPVWACNGQLVGIQANPALYSLIGTTYGGDGRHNFAMPNLTPPPGLEHHSYFIVNEGIYPSDDEEPTEDEDRATRAT